MMEAFFLGDVKLSRMGCVVLPKGMGKPKGNLWTCTIQFWTRVPEGSGLQPLGLTPVQRCPEVGWLSTGEELACSADTLKAL